MVMIQSRPQHVSGYGNIVWYAKLWVSGSNPDRITMNKTRLLKNIRYVYLHYPKVNLSLLEPYINYYIKSELTWDKFIYLKQIKTIFYDPAGINLILEGVQHDEIYKGSILSNSKSILTLLESNDLESRTLGKSLIKDNYYFEINGLLWSPNTLIGNDTADPLIGMCKNIYLIEKVNICQKSKK